MNIKYNIPEYGVSEFNKIFRDIIETNFDYVKIRGEISELRTATKGQIYITIKDKESILSAVIWESKKKLLSIKPDIGMEIIATGKITTWSRYKTTYQLDIDNLEIAGEGALLKIIEERKKRLALKGIFDQKYKKKLPYLPNKIGIITSPTGSVIHDIINRIKERFPINIDLWPTSVQGIEATEMIITAIEGFNNNKYVQQPDVIIIARGGGSVEDLMVFNDENLAISVYNSKIPIVSAIGHETDTTIIDFVSDLRVPTPTAAAEKIVPVREDLIIQVKTLSNRLLNSINNKIKYSNSFFNNFIRLLKDQKYILQNYNERFENINKNFFNFFKILIVKKNNELNYIQSKLNLSDDFLKFKKIQLQNIVKNLEINISQKINNNFINLNSIIRILNSNSVTNNLEKGYVLLKKYNKIIKRSKDLKKKDDIKIKFFDKEIKTKINQN